MAQYQLAQLNIALMSTPLDSPAMSEFVANLDRINALAESSPGFVWRLKDETGNATALRDFGNEYLVNMSVWEDIDSLYNYVFQSAHTEIMKRRKEWFERMREAYSVLWWVPAGHRPTTAEAKQRLQNLRENGPNPEAFTFKRAFPMPGDVSPLHTLDFNDVCPAS